MDVKSDCEIYPEDALIYALCIFGDDAPNRLSALLQLSFSCHGFLSGMFLSFLPSLFPIISDVLELWLSLLCVKTFKGYNLVPVNKLSNILIHFNEKLWFQGAFF